MALTERTRLYEFLVRLGSSETGDRIYGMHVSRIREVLDDGEVIMATQLPAETVDFAGLVPLMHPDDIAALAAVLTGGE